MIPLLFVLADTVEVPIDPQGIVLMHEWGVVEVDMSVSLATGAPGATAGPLYPIPIDPDFCVEAPVVWFHGDDFTGIFTVEAPGGHLTVTYPEPDRVDTDQTGMPLSAVWRVSGSRHPLIMERVDAVEEETFPVPEMGHFGWAADIWRSVPGLSLTGIRDGWSERFIYYECQVEDLFTLPEGEIPSGWPLSQLQVPGLVFASGTDGQPLMSPISGTGDLETANMEYIDYSRQVFLDTVWSWSEGRLLAEEVAALVDTWEATLTSVPDGELRVLFPIPEDRYDRISTLELVTDEGHQVCAKRIFLGLVTL